MKTKDIGLAILIMAIWGFNFSVIKLGADQINPVMLTALRFTFAVFPAIFFIKRPTVKWRYLIGYGVCFGVGVWGMMTIAVSIGLSAGMAGVLLNLNIVTSLFLAKVFLKESLSKTALLGVSFAIFGLVLSFLINDGSVPFKSIIFVLIAVCSWSLMGLIIKRSATVQIFAFSVWGMLFAPLSLFTLAFIIYGGTVFTSLPQQLNSSIWFSILFQAYPTTLFGYWIYNRLLMQYPLSIVAPLSLTVPVFGLIGSAIFYQEHITWPKLFVVVFILSGVVLNQIRAKP